MPRQRNRKILGPACLSDTLTAMPLGQLQSSRIVWRLQPSSVNSWTVKSCFAGGCLQLQCKVQLFAAVVKSTIDHKSLLLLTQYWYIIMLVMVHGSHGPT